MIDKSVKPIPLKDVDFRTMKAQPSPEDFFLLSRLDGKLTVGQLCQISGLSAQATMEAIERLWDSGLIELPGHQAPKSEASFGAVGAPDPQNTPRPPSKALPPTPTPPPPKAREQQHEGDYPDHWVLWPVRFERFSFDPAAMAEAVDLTPAQRKELLYTHGVLKHLDHYQLLGVARDAERKEIRTAYFSLSKRYHPDLFYGSELGSFRPKLDDIFKALNGASQSLSSKQKRAKYDKGLSRKPRAEAATSSLGAPPSQPSEPQTGPLDLGPSGGLQAESEERRKKRDLALSTLVKRGERLEAAGHFAQAAQEYERAFSVVPDVRVALRGANLYMRAGGAHLDAAIALAQAAAKLDGSNPKLLLTLGDALEEKGAHAQARQQYEKARELDPSNKVVHRRLRYLDGISS